MSLLTLVLSTAMVTAVWWSLPALSRPTLPFGVAVPLGRIAEPAIARARKSYSRTVFVLGAAVTAASVLMTFIADPVPVFAVSTLGLLVADTAAYLFAGRAVRSAKRSGDWYAGTRQAVTADLSFRTDPVRLPWGWIVPSVAILLATTTIGIFRAGSLPDTLPGMSGLDLAGGPRIPTGFWFAANPVLAQAAITIGVPLLLIAMVRARPEIDAARPSASARRYRIYLRGIAKLTLLTVACANLMLLGLALRLWELLPPSILATTAIFAPLSVTAVAVVVFELRVGAGGHRLPARPEDEEEDTGLVQRDTDRHWHLGGFVYINRDDPAFLVHQRVGGSQWTINLGHPAGRIIVAFLAVSFVAGIGAALLDTFGILDLPNTHGF